MRKTKIWGLQLLFGWMNLALAIPSIYLMFGLPLMLRQHGWAGTDIGLLQLAALFALTFTISIATTWLDIPVNALAVQWLPRSEQLRAGSIRSAALFLGAIVGGGGMVLALSRCACKRPYPNPAPPMNRLPPHPVPWPIGRASSRSPAQSNEPRCC